jgi:hypothetical protein
MSSRWQAVGQSRANPERSPVARQLRDRQHSCQAEPTQARNCLSGGDGIPWSMTDRKGVVGHGIRGKASTILEVGTLRRILNAAAGPGAMVR